MFRHLIIPPRSVILSYGLYTSLTSKIETGTFSRCRLRRMEDGEPNEARRSTSAREARAFSFDEVCNPFSSVVGQLLTLEKDARADMLFLTQFPVVRNTAESISPLHRHPTPLTPDEPFPA